MESNLHISFSFIADVAERLTSLLGRCSATMSGDDESDVSFDDDDEDDDFNDDDDDDDDTEHHDNEVNESSAANEDSGVSLGGQWESELNNHDRNLILAGYNNCMDEAIRFLIEEEKYSSEHPVVQGLKQHLVSQQERLEIERLLETARVMNEQCSYSMFVDPLSTTQAGSTDVTSVLSVISSLMNNDSTSSCNNSL